jgi:hypothetical protein
MFVIKERLYAHPVYLKCKQAVQRDNKGIHHVVLVVMRAANTGGS